jgi:hypothetical protein
MFAKPLPIGSQPCDDGWVLPHRTTTKDKVLRLITFVMLIALVLGTVAFVLVIVVPVAGASGGCGGG